MGWSGIENGELLARAAAEGFDALITNDRKMEQEQDGSSLPLTVVILMAKTNSIEAIRPLYPTLLHAPQSLEPHTIVKVGEM